MDYTERIRVAFFADILISDYDGACRTMFQLINRIDSNKFEYIFICGEGPDEINGFACFKAPSVTLPINRNYKMAMPFFAKEKLNEELDAFDPHVVHISTPSLLGQFALNYAQQNHLPVLSIYHTHFISYIDYYLKHMPFLIDTVKNKMMAVQRNFYNRCHTIYVPSLSIAAELETSGIDAHRMKIWKRGIDTALFSPGKKSRQFMQQLTGNNIKTILFASRLVWEKNVETLIRIYNELQQQQMPYNLVVAGDGVALKAAQKDMPGVIFTGKVGHDLLSQLYASSNAFLFTSVSETYGNVVLEAMASGLPCVIADGGGSGDFIEDGVNGFKCDPFDEKEYVTKLKRVLQDESLANRFAEAGLQHSRQMSWDALAEEYFNDVAAMAETAAMEEMMLQ